MVETDIEFYPICMLLAFILNIVIVFVLNKNKDRLVYYMLIYENIGFIYGGKLLTYLMNIDKYKNYDFLEIGFSSFGGLIGGLLMLFIFCLQFKKDFTKVFKIFMVPVPLMYSIGKIGCFLAGCCYGIKYDGFGSVVYWYANENINGISLFPVQLLESIVFFLIFIYTLKNREKNQSINIAMLICAISKFILDFFREYHVGKIITINQVLCLIFVLFSLYLMRLSKKNIDI